MKKRKLSICGGTVLCKPKNGSPFRNLNRRGGSLPRPPLVSVDSLSSLRPKGRSCHWQAGRFAPPLQESCMDWTKAGGLLASPLAKTSKENHTSYRDFSFLAAGDVFFHSPFRSLNRRGGSPPLVSVDSRGSLRPKGRSCRWQAGSLRSPRKAMRIGQKPAVYQQLRQHFLTLLPAYIVNGEASGFPDVLSSSTGFLGRVFFGGPRTPSRIFILLYIPGRLRPPEFSR